MLLSKIYPTGHVTGEIILSLLEMCEFDCAKVGHSLCEFA